MNKTKKFQKQIQSKRPQNLDVHLHSKYIRQGQRLSQGPYNNLKRQIQYGNFFNPNSVQKKEDDPQQAVDQLQKIIQAKQMIERGKLSQVKKFTLKPVINNNYISGFDESEYHLNEQDKVKIVKQKVFKVQNYYNYLYELKFNQKVEEINDKVSTQIKKAKSQTVVKKISQNERSIKNGHDFAKQDQINRSSNIDKSKSLAPVHAKYEQQNMRNSYFLKQKDRSKIQQKFKRKYQNQGNLNYRQSSNNYQNRNSPFRNNERESQKFGFNRNSNNSGNLNDSYSFKF